MADDKKPAPPAPPERDAFVEITWIIVCILILLYLVSGVVNLFTTGRFAYFWNGSGTSKTVSLSTIPSLLGDKVATSKSTPVLDSPGGSQIATEPAGARGTLLEGPLIKNGVKYWHVQFDDGVDGWVSEDALSYLKLEKTPLSSVDDVKLGDNVSVSVDYAQVFAEPGVDQVAREKKGTNGNIVGGPITKDGIRYWRVHFYNGTEGWVREGDLNHLHTVPVPLSSMPTLIGGTVATSKNGTAVYDGLGGKQIATKEKGVLGEIIEGPAIKDGVKYWHVKFDDGTDGWVKESDLNYVSEPSLLVRAKNLLKKFVHFWKYFAMLLSGALIVAVVYLFRKVRDYRVAQVKLIYPEVLPPETVTPVNPHWERILLHSDSLHENDWRLAILEADILLGDLLEKLSLPGETIGEKLKAVDKNTFTTIDSAWEAHKIRNQIAHDGPAFLLNGREAKRVISLYKSVFNEFKVL